MPIIIKSKKEGFRRAGIAHSKKATEYPYDYFTDEQLAMLDAEPMLTVEYEFEEVPPNQSGDGKEQTDPGDGVEKTPLPAVDGKGQLIKGAPEDEADFLVWLDGLTVPDLKYICRDIDIDFPAKAKKADLIELITFNTAFPPAEATDPEA